MKSVVSADASVERGCLKLSTVIGTIAVLCGLSPFDCVELVRVFVLVELGCVAVLSLLPLAGWALV